MLIHINHTISYLCFQEFICIFYKQSKKSLINGIFTKRQKIFCHLSNVFSLLFAYLARIHKKASTKALKKCGSVRASSSDRSVWSFCYSKFILWKFSYSSRTYIRINGRIFRRDAVCIFPRLRCPARTEAQALLHFCV